MFITNTFEGKGEWLNRDRGLFERGGLLNFAKKVSVLHKELECSVEKLKYKTFEVTKLRIKNKIQTSSFVNKPIQSIIYQ